MNDLRFYFLLLTFALESLCHRSRFTPYQRLRHLLLYSCLGLLLLTVAMCDRSHPRVEALLQQADSLVEETPDSALLLLDSLYLRQKLSRQETARYALLLAQAADKTYRTLAPYDSLIDIALDYYNRETPHRATALLYKARIEKEFAQQERAIGLLQEGLSIIQRYPKEKDTKRKILSSLGVLYDDNGHYEEALSIYRDFYNVCEAEKDKAIALDDISGYYALKGMADSAFHYIREALRFSVLSEDSTMISTTEYNLALFHYYFNQPDSALIHIKKALSSPIDESRKRLYYGTLGGILYKLDQTDSAIYYLDRSIDTDKYEQGQATTLLSLYQIERYLGHYERASDYLEKHVTIIDSLYSAERDTEISNLIHEHKTELRVQETKDREKHKQFLLALSSIFLFLLAILTYLYYRNKRIKDHRLWIEKQHENEQKIATLQSLIDSNQTLVQMLNEEKDKLESEINILLHSQVKQEEKLQEMQNRENSLLSQIEESEQLIMQSKRQISTLENWQFTQTKIYKRVLELREAMNRGTSDKPLNNAEVDKLRTTLLSLNKPLVQELKRIHTSLQDDDILLYLLEERTDLDAKAIAICFGTTSTHTINQRRYRMKNRMG